MAVKKFFDTKKIVLLATMLALTSVFCFVPIKFGPITLALMILPTLIISQCQDFWTTLVMGVLMSLINYIAWFTTKAAELFAPIFQNPLVSILPRILIGIAAWGVKMGLSKLLLKAKYKYNESGKEIIVNRPQLTATEQGISAFSTAVGVFVNTLFVGIFTLIFFSGTTLGKTTISVDYILGWFGLNFGIEIVAFSLLTPPIVLALKKAKLVPADVYGKKIFVGNPEDVPSEKQADADGKASEEEFKATEVEMSEQSEEVAENSPKNSGEESEETSSADKGEDENK